MDLAKKKHQLLNKRSPTRDKDHHNNNNNNNSTVKTVNNNICNNSNNITDSLEDTLCHQCNKASLHYSTSNRCINSKWDSPIHSSNSKCILIYNRHQLMPYISKFQFSTKTRWDSQYKLKWACLTTQISKWRWVVQWHPNISLRPCQCQWSQSSTVPSASVNFKTLVGRTLG